MLISHDKKFIFIHTYKVAGSSIRSALQPYSSISFRQSPVAINLQMLLGLKPWLFSQKFDGHISALQLSKKIPTVVFDSYYKFAFVRNPWDWQVSLYQFGLKDKNHYQHQLFKQFKNFDEYLDWRVNKELRLQKQFVCDEEDKLLVDFIGRFENLQADFNHITQHLGLHTVTLPHLNKSKESTYKEFYNTNTSSLVAEAFAPDIKMFNYTF